MLKQKKEGKKKSGRLRRSRKNQSARGPFPPARRLCRVVQKKKLGWGGARKEKKIARAKKRPALAMPFFGKKIGEIGEEEVCKGA